MPMVIDDMPHRNRYSFIPFLDKDFFLNSNKENEKTKVLRKQN